MFGISDDVFSEGSFKGTLFRFPLRKVASELSPTVYSDVKVCTLFDSFASDAHLVLLFFKHIESIELYVREESNVEPKRSDPNFRRKPSPHSKQENGVSQQSKHRKADD